MKTISVDGDFVAGVAIDYVAEGHTALANGEAVIVFDLSRSKYLDSIAIGSLNTLAEAAKSKGGVVLLDGISDDFMALLQVFNFDSVVFHRRAKHPEDASEDWGGPRLVE